MPALRPPPFEIRPLPSKGLGVIATAFIPTNTLLLVSSPLLLLFSPTGTTHTNPLSAARILTAYASLPPHLRAAYDALSAAPTEENRVLGVWKSNNFCLDDQGTVNAVFDLPSRLNHSCLGGENARWEWDAGVGVMRFWAERDIQEGEEITHCYHPDWRMGTKNRRIALQEEYDFFCECVVCLDPSEDP
ncbi:SET domain-containing protein [Ascodesmis nigricans]|uniref:SET domain-containing protein n=1 Tax=Ascodesmis nigricans TaxID=341454 RepID=A0A4S2N0I7_9PEZI|nr:SET domain-containing protein [Ascodesmis nigricans]